MDFDCREFARSIVSIVVLEDGNVICLTIHFPFPVPPRVIHVRLDLPDFCVICVQGKSGWKDSDEPVIVTTCTKVTVCMLYDVEWEATA